MSKHMKILTTLSMVLFFSFVLISVGVAYAGGVRGVGLLGVSFFLTLGITLVLAQLIPAGILLFSIVATAFSSSRESGVPIRVS
jgi:hypothetical protein